MKNNTYNYFIIFYDDCLIYGDDLMKKFFKVLILTLCVSLVFTSCSANKSSDTNSKITTESADASQKETKATSESEDIQDLIPKSGKTYAVEMLDEEKESIQVGKLSSEHEYYQEVVTLDPECAEYINEISIYDKEIDDTFVVHVSLPPEYDGSKKYPMIVMTDGVWRLSDHPELRPLMKDGEIEPIIMVSVGYPNGYNYRSIRERDLIEDPESYLHFIVDNLVPYLSSQYSVDSENMTLTGHSYGGYWGFYALFNSDTIGKDIFKNYYIGSPTFKSAMGALDTDLNEEAYNSRSGGKLDKNVYISVGALEGYGFIKSITDFVDLLKERDYEGLNLTYEIIEDYDHNHVFKPSIKNTLLMFYGEEKNED